MIAHATRRSNLYHHVRPPDREGRFPLDDTSDRLCRSRVRPPILSCASFRQRNACAPTETTCIIRLVSHQGQALSSIHFVYILQLPRVYCSVLLYSDIRTTEIRRQPKCFAIHAYRRARWELLRSDWQWCSGALYWQYCDVGFMRIDKWDTGALLD